MRTSLLTGLAVLVLGLAACGGGGDDPSPPADSGGGAKLGGPLVYSRGGGIAGASYRLSIQPSGAATLESPGTAAKDVELGADALSKVAGAADAAGLPDLDKRTYAPAQTVSDGFQHRVVYGGVTVDVAEGSDAPAPVKQLVDSLSSLVTKYSR